MSRLAWAFVRYRWWSIRGRLRTQRRHDILGKASRWLDPILRVLFFLAMAPLGFLLAIAAFAVGWGLASNGVPIDRIGEPARVILFGLALFVVLGPILTSGRDGDGDYERLLLLPIPRTALHRLHFLATLADPWHLISLVLFASFPIGVALGGLGPWGFGELLVKTAAVSTAGGLLILANAAMGFWIFLLIQQVLRNRRRAEAAILGGFVLFIGLAYAPAFFVEAELPEGLGQAFFSINLPGELYVRVLDGVFSGQTVHTAWALGALAITGGAFLYLSQRAHRRLLLQSGQSGSRRSDFVDGVRHEIRIPGLSRATLAVARVQWHTLWRTVPGKLAILPAPIMVLIIGYVFKGFPPEWQPQVDLGAEFVMLAVGASFVQLNLQQFLFNNFAIDGAGASLQNLLPLHGRDLLLGKAMTWGFLVAGTVILSTPIALLIARPSWVGALWSPILVMLAAASSAAISIPTGLLFSALLPRYVDLSRAMHVNQPHTLSVLVSLVVLPFSFGTPVMIVAVGVLQFESIAAVVIGSLVWFVLSLFLGRGLGMLALDTWERRREAILLATQDR